jgi:protein dithiol oxidoreductase (disulfide-forming)
MHRRDFALSLMGAGALSLAASPLAALAQAGLKEGSDFRRLPQAVAVDVPAGQVEVLEFFSYGCIHCYNLEPALKAWLKQKPAHVVFKRVPVHFNAAFEPLQRLYYALEGMNLLDTLHEKAFQAIHVDRMRLNNADAVADWAAKQGVDRQAFLGMYNAFSMAGKLKRALQLQQAYDVEGTPAMAVAGRYYVPGQADRTLNVLNTLIAEARKG